MLFSFPRSRAEGVMSVPGPTGSLRPSFRADLTSTSETNSRGATGGGASDDGLGGAGSKPLDGAAATPRLEKNLAILSSRDAGPAGAAAAGRGRIPGYPYSSRALAMSTGRIP